MSLALSAGQKLSLTNQIRTISKALFPHWALWLLVFSLVNVNTMVILANPRLSMVPFGFAQNYLFCGVAIVLAIMRTIRASAFDGILHRLWALVMTTALAAILSLNLQTFSHLALMTDLPFVDETLLSWDKSLGFDWLAYSKFMTASPSVFHVLFFAYNSLTFLSLKVLAVCFVVLQMNKRCVELFFLMLTGLVCACIGVFFPSHGTLFTLADPELISRMGIGNASSMVAELEAYRGNGSVWVDPLQMQGLVSFPSFHTCMAITAAWCSRGRWFTLLPGCTLASTILVGTPIFGGHYLVDVFGGAVIALFFIWIWTAHVSKLIAPHHTLQA